MSLALSEAAEIALVEANPLECNSRFLWCTLYMIPSSDRNVISELGAQTVKL